MLKVVFSPEHRETLMEEVRKNPVLPDSADLKHNDVFYSDVNYLVKCYILPLLRRV